MDIISEFDRRRTEMMLDVGGVDMAVQRGWYSATDFWSPALFRQYLTPRIKRLIEITHQAGARFAYAMDCGAPIVADELLDAGIDLLYSTTLTPCRIKPISRYSRRSSRADWRWWAASAAR
jgi:hypothetical protein